MREYEAGTERKLERVVCNRCGKVMKVDKGILKEGCFHGEAVFGYFSQRDGENQSFDLCEDCYDKMTAEFIVPVKKKSKTEIL